MGNINCCESTKKNDKVFDLEKIFCSTKDQKKQESLIILIKDTIEIKKKPPSQDIPLLPLSQNTATPYFGYKINNQDDIIPINQIENNNEFESDEISNLNSYRGDEHPKLRIGHKDLIIENFDILSNSNLPDYLIENYVKEKDQPINWMKFLNHPSFGGDQEKFSEIFIKFLNFARSDFLGLSKILMENYNNFDLIQNKISQINDVDLRSKLFKKKEDFKDASNFFKELNEKKEKFFDLIEIDDLKLPIPLDKKDLKRTRYQDKFRRRFKSKFQGKFRVEQTFSEIMYDDFDISFLLFIFKKYKKLMFLTN